MLAELEPRVVKIGDQPARLYLGQGTRPLEVVIVPPVAGRPAIAQLRALLKKRTRGRATPVLIVVPWGEGRAAVCGPTEHDPLEHRDLSTTQVEALCRKALAASAHHDAVRLLQRLLPKLEAPIPGLRNEGLFAMQELEHGVPRRDDWDLAGKRARAVQHRRGRALIEGLGFQAKDLAGPGVLLMAGERRTAVAVLVDRPEELDSASGRFDGATAVSYALRQADLNNVDWVVAVADATLRLYPVNPGVGTAKRGRMETFVEIDLELCSRDHAAYLWLLFSVSALSPQGSVDDIRRLSADYAAELSGRLRERVYAEVMPLLCRAVVAGTVPSEDRPTVTELRDSYQTAVCIVYRLLLVAYAEDRGVLPLHTSRSYREHSLKRLGQRLLKARGKKVCFGGEGFYWGEVRQLWKAVSVGHAEWGISGYNGALFSSEAEVSRIGAKIADLTLPDQAFAPALAALLLDQTAEGIAGPVDFRSLGVREFGTIYEGLLESELSVADMDLAVHPKTGAYLPAKRGDAVEVEAGRVYLHNQSGARKSSGGYYTPHFVVEHLLDRVLEPALDDHCERLDGLSTREAGEHFFKIRVADIAMGSGHFLVGAVDRIERRLTNYLVDRPLPDVREELGRLRAIARQPQGGPDEIEDAQLLRRQVARRCIFGVDVNPMAVELARLSVWIHTFVPGLPLSLLDQNLIHGNSLVGIASFDEADELMKVDSLKLASASAKKRMEAVRGTLAKLALLTDANDAEIREARTLWNEYRAAMLPEQDRFTILAASRTNRVILEAIDSWKMATTTEGLDDDLDRAEPLEWERDQLIRQGRDEFRGLNVVHFPLAFPHVFRDTRGGFDVIVGNPPWEKVKVEEHVFWARYFPGLRACPQREREALKARYRDERPDLVAALSREIESTTRLRRLLTQGAFPGMGAGDPDLHKAFAWRFWGLAAPEGGRIGVVLPREAWSAYGSTKFREKVLAGAREIDVTMLTNTGQWVFESHPQSTIAITSITKGQIKARGGGTACQPASGGTLALRGPYPSREQFEAGIAQPPVEFQVREVKNWNHTASLPLLPSDTSAEVFAQLRKSPRLDLNSGQAWRSRPHRELDATNDKHLMDVRSEQCPDGFWPVYKGASFHLWIPDTGTHYAWADPRRVCDHLQGKRSRANRKSAFWEFDSSWRDDPGTLPCLRPRIAFRDVTNRTNQRTIIASLVPPRVFLAHKAPYLVWPRGTDRDVACLLGVLSSLPLDWYARRFVEKNVSFFILNPFPVPRPRPDCPLRERLIALAGRLAAPDDRFDDWAERVGVACGPMDADERLNHIHELDAVAAHLYGLSERQLIHVFQTFHEGWDYEERLRATLHHFRGWGGS